MPFHLNYLQYNDVLKTQDQKVFGYLPVQKVILVGVCPMWRWEAIKEYL